MAYFDTWDTFAAPGGGYTAYYRDGKQLTLVRADDGVHFNADGYTILMRSIAQFATQQFGLDDYPQAIDAFLAGKGLKTQVKPAS